ncbi:MAG: molecular chaperone DnaJ [Cystobacter sp.]
MAKGGQTPPEPGSPRMREAWRLKEAGDVVAARHAAERILADPSSPEEPVQAAELLRRADTPAALYGFAALAALVLLLLLSLTASRA